MFADQADPRLTRYNSSPSSDFNTVKALASGDVVFLGFKFILSNRLPVDGTNTDDRLCFAYTQDAIKLAVGKDITAKIDVRPDKSRVSQVYTCMSIDATRMEETKYSKYL